jgi:hypothetical protein
MTSYRIYHTSLLLSIDLMAIRPGIFISTPDTFPDTFMNKYIASSAPFPEKSALAPLMCGTRAENGDFAYKQELPVNCR